ncbi:allose kinase [Vibrio sinensis]|uniref:Allose kinase n=1 Tax=Vibrio sinensis TaxID=2302434 RepID=A0A3A6R1W3_9VIBR|nr:allose kinase [Vibrio sinensis]RJX75304.1 allose kinase [Vibrio sinensis]
MHKKSAYLGVDMGATHTRLCLLDQDNNILELKKIATNNIMEKGLQRGMLNLITDVVEEKQVFLNRAVIGLPATISKDRKNILSTPNLKVKSTEFSGLVSSLQEEFGCPVELERDVNLQITYDTFHMSVTDKTVLGCYLGSGFGFSIWLNGDVYTGAHGVAGELGHIPYGNANVRCGCGNHGCLESYVSGVYLKAEYDAQHADYEIGDFFDQHCNEAFISQFIAHAGRAIATTVNLFDPDIVLLGGGVMDMKGFPYNALRKSVLQHTRKPLPHDEVTFMKATSSSFNGATGAALQALNHTK